MFSVFPTATRIVAAPNPVESKDAAVIIPVVLTLASDPTPDVELIVTVPPVCETVTSLPATTEVTIPVNCEPSPMYPLPASIYPKASRLLVLSILVPGLNCNTLLSTCCSDSTR